MPKYYLLTISQNLFYLAIAIEANIVLRMILPIIEIFIFTP